MQGKRQRVVGGESFATPRAVRGACGNKRAAGLVRGEASEKEKTLEREGEWRSRKGREGVGGRRGE